MSKESREEAKLAKFNAKREKEDRKALARAAAHEARADEIDDRYANAAKHGRSLASGSIGGRFVEIFENGYVKVGKLSRSSPEKLLGVSGQAEITKKSALGRFAMGSLVMFQNVAFTPNRRGEIHLAIVTDRQTHILRSDLPLKFELEDFYKILAAAETVLEAQKATEGMTIPTATASDLAAQLRQIAELHDKGVLDENEFVAAKAKLLEQ